MSSLGPRAAITVILREHERLSAVVEGMRRYVHLLAGGKPVPGLMVFRAMLYYIREYPEQIHHPKEERYLFAPLRDVASEFDGVIDELETQHARGDGMLTNLEHALTRYELKGAPALAALVALVDEYAEFYSDHRFTEETLILPAARRLLSNEDWAELDLAFGANRDPFDGVKLEADLGKLFSMIVNAIPETED
ncbi:hemerythrin domain-containing protein [Burkholderia sp. USMB20]|uniref:hemerythrin domain-containing protein n=1 Tax=Burkholderia sp. USMB20 TaxID=1571773 RepID=UPI0005CF5779|nr:hemerythrin domain-containing protein [Burkholderia sp. USMB20]TGN97420.1 hemerythrin domain-containing protein [Burkholderia sp. USMB20]